MLINCNFLFVLVLFFQLPNMIHGQLNTLTEFPEDLQLYARDIQTNKAVIPIVGRVNSIGDSVSVVILRNGQPYSQEGIKPSGFNFELNPQIDAELAQYTVQLYVTTSGNTTLQRVADNIVAGDVYIISGQSNAEARMFNGSGAENNSQFIRVYGTGSEFSSTLLNNLEWFVGQGDGNRESTGNTGQWGLHLAKQMVDNQQIPICIFNGARGGWAVEQFIKDDAAPENLSTNYGRLLYRLNRTKLADKVRAIFWYQGETDAINSMNVNDYKQLFTDIYDDWRIDCPSTEKVYIIPIRYGCTGQDKSVVIQEAHRQLAEELPDARIVSNKGLTHHADNCHFPYVNGYKELGRRCYRILNKDLYNQNQPYAVSPDIQDAILSAGNQIIIKSKEQDNLIWQNGSHTYFRLEGSAANVISGYTLGNYVVLQLDASPVGATGLTYLDERIMTQPYIINPDGQGMVSFYNFPITTNNNEPIAINDSFTTFQNTPFNDNLIANDSDPDDDNLLATITPITPPANGTLNINADGTFTYTPNAGFYGADSFTYEICDDYTPITDYTGQVNSGADDVEEILSDGSIYDNSSDLEFVSDPNRGDQAVGIRITNITVPKDAIITSAYLEFVADETQSMPTSLMISAEATGNALAIPPTTNAVTSKIRTNATSSWTDIPAWTIGNTYTSTDMSAIIQELVSRGDWQSANAMTFIIEGTGRRTAESYEGDAALAPKLKITYKDPDNSLSIQQCDEATVNITVEQTCIELNISTLLEGAFDASSNEMTTELSSTRGLLPGQTPTSALVAPTPAGQPYNIAPWNYAGTEGAGWTDADYTGNETDWILVSFRTDIAKSAEVGMTAALLMKDGSIDFPDRCALDAATADSLYVVIEHRNHMGGMSPAKVPIINGVLSYDFSTSDSYRDPTAFGQKQLITGEWVMFAGDASQLDFPSFDINGTDKTIWFDNNGNCLLYTSPSPRDLSTSRMPSSA